MGSLQALRVESTVSLCLLGVNLFTSVYVLYTVLWNLVLNKLSKMSFGSAAALDDSAARESKKNCSE